MCRRIQVLVQNNYNVPFKNFLPPLPFFPSGVPVWGRGSNSRFVRRCTNVYTEELQLTSLRWCCQTPIHQPCDVCDLPQGSTWSSPCSLKTVRFGPRSFNVSGQTLWNSLPVNIRNCKSFDSFKTIENVSVFECRQWLRNCTSASVIAQL